MNTHAKPANTHDPVTEAQLLISKLIDYHYTKGWVEGINSLKDNTDATYRRGFKAGRREGNIAAQTIVHNLRFKRHPHHGNYTDTYRLAHADALTRVLARLQHDEEKD